MGNNHLNSPISLLKGCSKDKKLQRQIQGILMAIDQPSNTIKP